MSGDVLKAINKDELEMLLEVLKRDMPQSVVALNWLRMQMQWSRLINGQRLTVLCPDGDWTDGTFVGLQSGVVDGYNVTLYTTEVSCERLENALKTTLSIPWTEVMQFTALVNKLVPPLQRVVVDKGYDCEVIPCALFHMKASEAENLPVSRPSEGVRLGPLSLLHIDALCSLWPHYSPSRRPLVMAMLQHNRSVGVFVQNHGPQGEEELAAMVLESDYGGLGLMQTHPKHKRKGYGTLALVSLMRSMGQSGVDPHLHVVLGNEVAMGLVQKVGLRRIDTSNWVFLEGTYHS